MTRATHANLLSPLSRHCEHWKYSIHGGPDGKCSMEVENFDLFPVPANVFPAIVIGGRGP